VPLTSVSKLDVIATYEQSTFVCSVMNKSEWSFVPIHAYYETRGIQGCIHVFIAVLILKYFKGVAKF
jgi:hypothetical protein